MVRVQGDSVLESPRSEIFIALFFCPFSSLGVSLFQPDQSDAATRLGISARQISRLYRRFIPTITKTDPLDTAIRSFPGLTQNGQMRKSTTDQRKPYTGHVLINISNKIA